jgi:hypothetical protein
LMPSGVAMRLVLGQREMVTVASEERRQEA